MIKINKFNLKINRFFDIDKIDKKTKKKFNESIYDQLAQKRIYLWMSSFHNEINTIEKEIRVLLNSKINPLCSDAVFTMWWQGEEDMPAVVKACTATLKKLDRKVIIIDKNNFTEYINLPDYIMRKFLEGKIGFAHFSDICRVYLVAMYGGIWVDSTVFIAKKVPCYMTENFFVFKQSPQLNECRKYGNWWISAERGNDLLVRQLSYLICYWKHIDFAMHYYIFHIFFKKIIDEKEENKIFIESIPTRITDTTHFLMKNYNNTYDKKQWEIHKEISPVFKCTYKIKNISADKKTYYNMLLNGELD